MDSNDGIFIFLKKTRKYELQHLKYNGGAIVVIFYECHVFVSKTQYIIEFVCTIDVRQVVQFKINIFIPIMQLHPMSLCSRGPAYLP